MPDLRSRVARLIEESKRRGVLRVAAVYLVGAWLAIQVADTTFPRLGLPDGAVTFVIVLLAALFPVVVALTWFFDLTRTGPRRVPEIEHDLSDGPATIVPARVRARVPITLAALLAVPLLAFGLWRASDAGASGLDPQLVAVTPFRVAGATSDIGYLREGLMDLLAARIGGAEDGLRVVPPRTMSRRLREQLGSLEADPETAEALELAADLGAGLLLEGVVVGNGERLIVSAKLYDVASGSVQSEPDPIEVHADSLHRLVDILAARVIASESGLRADRLASITTRSVPALRAFIEAEHAFRRGRHAEAVAAYDQAVQLDTTFALAALGLLRARGWSVALETETDFEMARRIVERGLDRMGEADRAFVEVFTRGPADLQGDRIEHARRVAARHPEQADLQYLAGDRLLHFGEWVGVEDALDRARVQLERVVTMDSAYAEPVIHLFELAIMREDTVGIRRYGDLLLAIDSTNSYAAKVRYVRALGLDGSRDAPRVRLDTLAIENLNQITHVGWGAPIADDVRDEYMRRWREARLPAEVESLSMRIELMAMRGGQLSLIEEVDRRIGHQQWTDVTNALRSIYWLRDADAAREWMEGMRAQIPRMLESEEVTVRQTGIMMECLSGHYAVTTEDAVAARHVEEALADTAGLANWVRSEARACAMYVRAGAAVAARQPDARRQLTLLDDYLRAGPMIDEYIAMTYQLGVAWMWEELGDPERALAAVRRRIYVPFSQFWLNEMKGEEARLLDGLGRREEAIRAYGEYLSHFQAPEGPFVERVERARGRLAALAGEARN